MEEFLLATNDDFIEWKYVDSKLILELKIKSKERLIQLLDELKTIYDNLQSQVIFNKVDINTKKPCLITCNISNNDLSDDYLYYNQCIADAYKKIEK